jgi:hypothetical protein
MGSLATEIEVGVALEVSAPDEEGERARVGTLAAKDEAEIWLQVGPLGHAGEEE